MNAIVSLCHFCEEHGPKILFCTQPFRPQEPVENASEDLSHKQISARISEAQTLSSASSLDLKDSCEGCKSIQTGFMSPDETAQVSYVSTQQPYNPEVFTRVRQACIRSLSCEVCQGREGPIFFGDKQCGQVLSYTFYIKDTHARGMNRWFSIMVVMMDKIYLLNSWPFLVPHIRMVIENLQAKAQKVFDQEEAKCPQRPYRMAAQVDPTSFMKRKRGNKPARSLQELTGDKNVYGILHVAFVWILKTCGNRITETLLEGPPTNDAVIDMENQEETEEGFIKIYTLPTEDSVVPNSSQNMLEGGEAEKEEPDDPESPKVTNLRQIQQLLGSNNFVKLAHHVIIGNQVIVRGDNETLVKSVINTLKILLPKGCCQTILYSSVYEESFKCNFLGIKSEVVIPSHIASTERYVLVDVESQTGIPSLANMSGLESDIGEHSEDTTMFKVYQFKITSPVTLPLKVPTVLDRMLMALQNNNLSLDVVDTCFTCLKEQWMNKVKVLFKFTKAGGNRSEEDSRKLWQVVGAKDEDKPVLKHWMTGLSLQYKTQILSLLSSSSPSSHR